MMGSLFMQYRDNINVAFTLSAVWMPL